MKEIETVEEFENVLKNKSMVIVDFYADWCGPCQKSAPTFKKLSLKYPDIEFIKVNTDDEDGEGEDISAKYTVEVLPTFMSFSKGKVHSVVKGFKEENLKKLIEELLA